MSTHRFVCCSFALFSVVLSVAFPSYAQAPSNQSMYAGQNVNMVSGTTLPGGDPWLQRQNEPSIAVSTRNPRHIMAGANDYRTVDYPSSEGQLPGATFTVIQRFWHGLRDLLMPWKRGTVQSAASRKKSSDPGFAATPGDAWQAAYKSLDGGASWSSTLIPGFPQDTSTRGFASPLKKYSTASDPTVRAGTNGMFYYSGIVFNRTSPSLGAVFMVRYIDNNNSESSDPIQYLDTQIINAGTTGQFFDMPSMAVDIPRGSGTVVIDTIGDNKIKQTIPAGNVYVVYSVFLGQDPTNVHSALYFLKSADCGQTWGKAIKVSEGTHKIQGAKIAIDPASGAVYVVWRSFASDTQLDAIEYVKSKDLGNSFSAPAVISNITPFDQASVSQTSPYSPTAFRTNSYPTIAVDSMGYVHCAWSQKGAGSSGESKILMSNLDPTAKKPAWSTPTRIDQIVDGTDAPGHQLMPVMTFGAGKLVLVWYDQRGTAAKTSGKTWLDANSIMDGVNGNPVRQTLDVFAAQADPGPTPDFEKPWQVSRYAWVLNTDGVFCDPTKPVCQGQYNPPNYPLFAGGTTPFHGDYFDIAPAPAFVLDNSGKWQFNTAPSNAPVFHVTWTDNRDVRPPDPDCPDRDCPGDWTRYNPPNSAQPDFSTGGVCTDPTRVGMRNQNIYTSRLSPETDAGALFNNKPLAYLGNFPGGASIPRTYIVYVRNDSDQTKIYRLRITARPLLGNASFQEFAQADSLDVAIDAHSTISRTVFAASQIANDTFQIGVFEVVDGVEHPKSTIILNQDATTPPPSPTELSAGETTNPNIVNPNIVNWSKVNPNIVNPNIVNPNIVNPNIVNPNIVNPNIVNLNIVNPNIVNPNIVNPSIVNPNIVNPNIVNPNIVNQNIVNASLTDATWEISNAGNTAATYRTKLLSKKQMPVGVYAQLLIYRQTYTPAGSADSCSLEQEPHDEVLLNVTNPNIVNPNIVNPNIVNPNIVNPNIVNPNIVNTALEDTDFSIAAGEKVFVTLRVISSEPSSNSPARAMAQSEAGSATQADDVVTQLLTDNMTITAVSQAVNTADAQQGIITPPAAATRLVIATGSLEDGFSSTSYQTSLAAIGGTPPYLWSLNSGELPPGLSFSSQGQISGIIPPETQGTFYFVVRVDDAGGQFDTQRYSIYVNPDTTPSPLVTILTPLTLPGAVQGFGYGTTLESAGGKWPRTWSIMSDSLPPGLTLDSSGVISGTPNADGTYTFVAKVADASDPAMWAEGKFSITVNTVGTAVTYATISGTVRDAGGNPLSDVVMRGLPDTPLTDSSGHYADTVPGGWSGTVSPFKAGYSFGPESRTYSSIRSDQQDENYNEQYILTVKIAGSGSVKSSPAGIIDCGSTCSDSLDYGTWVLLTATPSAGSSFTGWGGSCSATDQCAVLMDSAKTVTANFALSGHNTLTVLRSGNGTGTVSSSPVGIDCGSSCSADFSSTDLVTLNATFASGIDFSWSGACSGNGTCSVSMGQARFVTAIFNRHVDTFNLTVNLLGAGTVVSSPAGINCNGSTCSGSFNSGTSVTISAIPAIGSTFSGWSGDACSGTGTCSVTMLRAQSVTAIFAVQAGTYYPLTVTKTGTGPEAGTVISSPGGINCGPVCSTSFTSGVSITLTATASSGSSFTGWGGACSGTGACTVKMKSAQSVTAAFAVNTYPLNVNKTGTGNGSVSSTPAGINCGSTCSGIFNYGTSVNLTALPANGSGFAGWSSSCSGAGTCTVPMNQAQSVTAEFTPISALQFSAQPSNGISGQNMPQIKILATDAEGHPLSNVPITLTLSNGCSSAVLSNNTAVTDSYGIATFSTLQSSRGGWGYTLTASSGSVTSSASNTFDVTGFCETGNMTHARDAHTATLLPNGKVLVVGGQDNGMLASSELYDPISKTWSATEYHMTTAREYHTATLLPDGQVLVTGGYNSSEGVLSSAELYNPGTGSWSPTGAMTTPRFWHTATLLANGKVLLTGGYYGTNSLASSELYDPATRTFSPTGSLINQTDRWGHLAVLLPNGKVLVSGGWHNQFPSGGNALASAQLYDPNTGTWSATGSMIGSRSGYTLTLLPNGKVLAAGGWDGTSYLNTAELYDPVTGSWTQTGSTAVGRTGDAAALLSSGKVLVAGGNDGTGAEISAEQYDPTAGIWSAAGSMATSRYWFTMTLLPSSGAVLVAGGSNYPGSDPVGKLGLASSELFYPDTRGQLVFTSQPGNGTAGNTLSAVQVRALDRNGKAVPDVQVNMGIVPGSCTACTLSGNTPQMTDGSGNATFSNLSIDRGGWGYRLVASAQPLGAMTASNSFDVVGSCETNPMANARDAHTATLLPNGKVLVVGGYSDGASASSELYDPASKIWSITTSMSIPREWHTATLLPSGKVLVVGGWQGTVDSGSPLASAEVYDPVYGTWAITGSMATARYNHTATLLPSGKVLVTGGTNGPTLASAELYDPATGTFSLTGPMSEARYVHLATLLPNGKVLVAGGWQGAPDTGKALASAELYNPAYETWSQTTPMNVARNGYTLTLLPNGKVLAAGGYDGTVFLNSAELYDPTEESWTPTTGSMAVARVGHAAILLSSGKVLVAGGNGGTGSGTSAELYDPVAGTWSTAGSMASPRYWFTMTLLPYSGAVLVAGGSNSSGSNGIGTFGMVNSEIFYPERGISPPAVISLAGANNQPLALNVSQQILTVSWTQATSFNDVTIAATVARTVPGVNTYTFTAYLTNQIGPGTTAANEIAHTTMHFPADANYTRMVLFNIPYLFPGTYYLTLSADNVAACDGQTVCSPGGWAGGDLSPSITTAPGVAGNSFFYTIPSGVAPYPPASLFSEAAGANLLFDVTGVP